LVLAALNQEAVFCLGLELLDYLPEHLLVLDALLPFGDELLALVHEKEEHEGVV
jgi:hypothetical protein